MCQSGINNFDSFHFNIKNILGSKQTAISIVCEPSAQRLGVLQAAGFVSSQIHPDPN
jgi:hypothetical protein